MANNYAAIAHLQFGKTLVEDVFAGRAVRKCAIAISGITLPDAQSAEDGISFIETFWDTFLAVDASGKLAQVARPSATEDCPRLLAIAAGEIASLEAIEADQPGWVKDAIAVIAGPLAGFHLIRTDSSGTFSLWRDGLFVCAEQSPASVVCNRSIAGPWERFRFVPSSKLLGRT